MMQMIRILKMNKCVMDHYQVTLPVLHDDEVDEDDLMIWIIHIYVTMVTGS